MQLTLCLSSLRSAYMSPNAEKVRQIFLNSLYAVMNGTKSVDDALSEGQKDMQAAIDEALASSDLGDLDDASDTPATAAPSSATKSMTASISSLLFFVAVYVLV